jgi:glycosyltransferase involved in cell wall biosynthesis
VRAPDVGTVVVSAGFSKTHVTTAAAEASERGILEACITGAYPTPWIARIARALRLTNRGRLARLFERGERIPTQRVRSQLLPELLYDFGRSLIRVPVLSRVHAKLCAATWRLYGWRAARQLGHLPGTRVFHVRAGFGQSSIRRAKELGMITLCDHALAHPSVLGRLITTRGVLPSPNESKNLAPVHSLDEAVLTDIDAADAIVVNSEFVKDTYLAVGWQPEQIHVIYLGVDDNFLHSVDVSPRKPQNGPLGLLFAGLLDRRKGAEELIEALIGLSDVDWELRIAGLIPPEIRTAHADFLADKRVTELGVLSRSELAREMQAAPLFVFPSLAEGSARVVFEAMACGAFVITTPNAGTIVQDDVHGTLVPPGDAISLRDAIASANANRGKLVEVGDRNASLIRRAYTQKAYGDRLYELYAELAG